MFQIQDVLIPARFICFILQVLLTISLGWGYKDFIDINNQQEINGFWSLLSFFFIFEIFEFLILLSGYTLFIDLLSVIQIFFHSVAVLLLNWLYRDVWVYTQLYIPFIIGGIIPFLLELYNIIVLCSSNRVLGKIK